MKKIFLDKQGRITYVNDNFLIFFNTKIEDIILKRLDDAGMEIYHFKRNIDQKKDNAVFLIFNGKSAKVIIKKKAT